MAARPGHNTGEIRGMKWKLALAQHPMYLLIREDTQCAERTPPWGAPSIEAYNRRLQGNLDALRKFPQLKCGYEWSGYELELLCQDNAELFEQMCALAHDGRTTFYNGTFAQPHLQTLSSEANIRQFEYGLAVYRDKCNHPVRVYAHQEASVHDQVPQLLAAFGIRYGIVPRFSTTLGWLDEGELVLFGGQGPKFVQGHEFVRWVGLDGTEVPLYLRQSSAPGNTEDLTAMGMVAGCQHIPPIVVDDPDLIGVDEAWLDHHAGADLVLLEAALDERLAACPPRARARFYSQWSYIEGIRAEELSRTNWAAEKQALAAEAMESIAQTLIGREAAGCGEMWRTILALQHHDVYCFCAPELRDKAIGRLREAREQARAVATAAAEAVVSRIDCRGAGDRPVVLFNTTPHAVATVASVEVPVAQPIVKDGAGNVLPAESTPTGEGGATVRFLAEMPALGYRTLSIHAGEAPRPSEAPLTGGHVFENRWYWAQVAEDGGFRSLVVKPSETELLAEKAVGNLLTATDTTGQSRRRAGGPTDLHNRTPFTPPPPGPALAFEAAEGALLRRSPLGHTIVVRGRLGKAAQADLVIRFYHHLPRIDITWTFDFATASIGNFYDDDSKLKVQWPLARAESIWHDIAFGVIEARDERALFPASWIDVGNREAGLATFHTGTLKHWVRGNRLYNLFAWGEDTDAIGSRMWRANWSKAFDQRLRGRHVIRTAVYPHEGDWRSADVVGAAGSFGATPLAVAAEPHPGDLPNEAELVRVRRPGLVATSVRPDGPNIAVRAYALESPVDADALTAERCGTPVLTSLEGEPIDRLEPFQIGQFTLPPRR